MSRRNTVRDRKQTASKTKTGGETQAAEERQRQIGIIIWLGELYQRKKSGLKEYKIRYQ